jgi:excisionase family DNA binding protein
MTNTSSTRQAGPLNGVSTIDFNGHTPGSARYGVDSVGPLERLLTQDEVAEHFGVSLRTVENWRQRGVMPFIRIGKIVRIKASDLERLIESRRVGRKGSR